MTQSTPPPSAPAARWVSPLLHALAVALLGLWFFSPAREAPGVGLDASNYASYAYFTAHHLQFGTQVVPMAGPFGFVPYGFHYAGNLFTERLVLELITKLALGALVIWFFRQAPRGWLRWLWLALLLILTPLVDDLPYAFAILLAGLFLVDSFAAVAVPDGAATSRAPPRLPLVALVAAFLALLSLFKGTQTMLACCTLVFVVALGIISRQFARVGVILGAFFLSLAVLMLSFGQGLANLPGYLFGVLELSSGYNQAMVVEESRRAFLGGASAILLIELLLLFAAWRVRRMPAALAAVALMAGFSFIQWKHGFVRADGHIFIFFQFACVAAPMALILPGAALLPRLGARWQAAIALPVLAAIAIGIMADGEMVVGRHRWLFENLPPRFALSVGQVFSPVEAKRKLHAAVEEKRDAFELPAITATVGRDSIDFFGIAHGYILLNRLNYQPRPMGGGAFNVFTKKLQDLNYAYVSNPKTRPDYYLVDLETVDHHFVAQDDGLTLFALMHAYEPTATEQDLLLLRARKPAAVPPETRLLETRAISFGAPIVPPEVAKDEILLMSLSLPPNLRGRVRAFLYKTPQVFADLTGDGIDHPTDRRVIPSMLENPVPFSPLIENKDDLLGIYCGEAGKRVKSFTLETTRPQFFDHENLSVSFHAAKRPAVVPGAERVRYAMRYPVFNRAPIEIRPATLPVHRFEGRMMQSLEPPGSIRWALTPQDNEVVVRYGIYPEAFTKGKTDGVEFTIEIERSGHPTQLLFQKWLRPLREPLDRPIQTQRIILPPITTDATLVVRTGFGVDHDGGWDWSFLAGVSITGDGYRLEQFPGFETTPTRVNAEVSGAMRDGDREIYMLNAPGSLEFELKGGEKSLVFAGGLLEGAYTNGNQTDGVGFTVTAVTKDGRETKLFHRNVAPLANTGDQGSVRMRVDLPKLAPGTKLVVAIDPGPVGNGAWDWSYLDYLRIE